MTIQLTKMKRMMLRAAWSAGLVLWCVGIGGMVPDPASEGHASDHITLRVPGTTVPFTMARCAGGEIEADGKEDSILVEDCFVLTTEVTWDLYDIYVYELDEPDGSSEADGVSRPSKPYIPPDRGFGHDGYPAIGMTYAAATGFCDWLSLKTGLDVRLPTAAEWVYFTVGDSEAEYCCEHDQDSLTEIAWFTDNAERTTHPVGLLEANLFGLFDVHGNAAEWVVTDSRKPIAMGGGFRDSAEDCTARSRQKQNRSWNTSDPQIPKSSWWLADCSWVGFRFVIETDSIDEEILKGLTHD